MSLLRRALGLFLLPGIVMSAGCGGTNPSDGTSPYNRSANGMTPAPGGLDESMPSPNAIVSVSAVCGAEQDTKQVESVFGGLVANAVVPKRIFLLGVTLKNIAPWIGPAKKAKIDIVPVPGNVGAKEWKEVLSKVNTAKLFGNGPSTKKPNLDGLETDLSHLTSSFALEGVQFMVLSPETTDKGGLPFFWVSRKLDEAMKNGGVRHIVSLSLQPLESSLPVVSDVPSDKKTAGSLTEDTKPSTQPLAVQLKGTGRVLEAMVRNNKSRAHFSISQTESAPSRSEEKGPFQVSISEKQVRLIQVLKGGGLKMGSLALTGETPSAKWTLGESVVLYDAMPVSAEPKPTAPLEKKEEIPVTGDKQSPPKKGVEKGEVLKKSGATPG